MIKAAPTTMGTGAAPLVVALTAAQLAHPPRRGRICGKVKQVGFEVPVGRRKFDSEPIGSDIESGKAEE